MSQGGKSALVLQYEVLEWVWNLAKKFEGDEDGVQKFRDHIQKYLSTLTISGAIDFNKALKELRDGQF